MYFSIGKLLFLEKFLPTSIFNRKKFNVWYKNFKKNSAILASTYESTMRGTRPKYEVRDQKSSGTRYAKMYELKNGVVRSTILSTRRKNGVVRSTILSTRKIWNSQHCCPPSPVFLCLPSHAASLPLSFCFSVRQTTASLAGECVLSR